MDKVQKPCINECYPPSSEPYRVQIDLRTVMLSFSCFNPTVECYYYSYAISGQKAEILFCFIFKINKIVLTVVWIKIIVISFKS
jgi:hypothetical protein